MAVRGIARSRAAGGWRSECGGARRGRRGGPARLLRRTTSRAPRGADARHGFLPLLQRGHRRAGSPGSRDWIESPSPTSTCTTATAPRRWWRTTPASSSPRSTRARSIPAPARRRKPASATWSTQRSPPGAARERWRAAFEGLVEAIEGFEPDLILVSAGFGRPRQGSAGGAASGGGRLRLGDPGSRQRRQPALRRPDHLVPGRRLRSAGPECFRTRPCPRLERALERKCGGRLSWSATASRRCRAR